jgi:hypothetical protein
MKMKTGKKITNRYLPEVFYIILLSLEGILKRCSLKDTILFKKHNSCYILNSELIDSGICFNLFSEYGVGNKLEEIIKDLMENLELDPEKYKNNIFYQEIVNLSSILMPLIRKEDSKEEIEWVESYAISFLNKVDNISKERLDRISILFKIDKDERRADIKKLKEGGIKIEMCNCNFCKEFRKFNYPRDKSINKIIAESILEIE